MTEIYKFPEGENIVSMLKYKIAELIYNLNPYVDQNVDADLRPVGKPFHIDFDRLLDYDETTFDAIMYTANQIINLVNENDSQRTN